MSAGDTRGVNRKERRGAERRWVESDPHRGMCEWGLWGVCFCVCQLSRQHLKDRRHSVSLVCMFKKKKACAYTHEFAVLAQWGGNVCASCVSGRGQKAGL